MPRLKRKGNWSHVAGANSIKDHVYLTELYAPYFAFCATKAGKHMLVEVDLDRLDPYDFYPDEDFVIECIRLSKDPQWDAMKATEKGVQKFVCSRIENFSHLWENSLESLGNISHFGLIPPSAITRILIYDPRVYPDLAMMLTDASITSINRQLVGPKYVALTRYLMGDHVSAEDIMDAGIYGDAYASLPTDVAPGDPLYGFAQDRKKQKDRLNHILDNPISEIVHLNAATVL